MVVSLHLSGSKPTKSPKSTATAPHTHQRSTRSKTRLKRTCPSYTSTPRQCRGKRLRRQISNCLIRNPFFDFRSQTQVFRALYLLNTHTSPFLPSVDCKGPPQVIHPSHRPHHCHNSCPKWAKTRCKSEPQTKAALIK